MATFIPSGIPERKHVTAEIERRKREQAEQDEVVGRAQERTRNQSSSYAVTGQDVSVKQYVTNGAFLKAGEIRIPITEEGVSMEKGTVVREELTVGRRAIENVRDISHQAEQSR